MSEHAGVEGEGQGARPLSEWAEEHGDVLWWRFPIEEPPYVGSPLSLGYTVEVEMRQHGREPVMLSEQVGGWPGHHTHWTPIQVPNAPCDEPPSGRDRNGLGGDSPAGAVAEGQAPCRDRSRPTAPATEQEEG